MKKKIFILILMVLCLPVCYVNASDADTAKSNVETWIAEYNDISSGTKKSDGTSYVPSCTYSDSGTYDTQGWLGDINPCSGGTTLDGLCKTANQMCEEERSTLAEEITSNNSIVDAYVKKGYISSSLASDYQTAINAAYASLHSSTTFTVNTTTESEDTDDTHHVGNNFCADENIKKGVKIVGIILMLAKFLVPLIIIVYGALDLYKAVLKGDEGSIGQQVKSIGVRVVIGILVFMLPSIVDAFLSLTEVLPTEYTGCEKCLVHPNQC